MKKSEVYLPSNDGKNQLHTVIWEPDTEYPRAILQIVHGMCEYVDRYDDFANYLTQNGFAVIGNDHLGHGKRHTAFYARSQYGLVFYKGIFD